MKNLNACLASLNLGLPDDVRRLKEAGYYTEAIARIDAYLAEDWTKTQNQPVQPGDPLPENPTPHGWMPCGMLCWPSGRSCAACRWTIRCPKRRRWNCCRTLCGTYPGGIPGTGPRRGYGLAVRGREKRYIRSFAETLLATHPELAARQIDPPLQHPSWERYEPEHDQMVRTGSVCADITLETCIGMSDAAFAAALAAAKQQGRSTVHVRVWLPLPAACPAQSGITLDSFTEPRPTLPRKMPPSALRTGRPTLPRTGPLAQCTATVPRPAMPTRCTCRRTPCSRILTRRRSCRIWSSRPICGHWRPSSPGGSPTRCRRQSASTTM